jgi:hypothetical protein
MPGTSPGMTNLEAAIRSQTFGDSVLNLISPRVMAGLVPAIHVLSNSKKASALDG